MMRYVLFVFCLLAVGLPCAADEVRTWTDKNDKKFDGVLIGVSSPTGKPSELEAQLKNAKGTVFSAPVEQFCPADQVLLRRFYLAQMTRGIIVEPAAPENRKKKKRGWILAVGADAYQRLPKLSFCSNDARDLAAAFVNAGYSQSGVTAVTGENATHARIRATLDQLLGVFDDEHKRVRPGVVSKGDYVVIAFSGHGVMLNGKSYLLTFRTPKSKFALTR